MNVNVLVEALPIVLSLICIESLLSVDNMMTLARTVAHLPASQRNLALRAGIIGGYVMRLSLMSCASTLANQPWLNTVCAAYLAYLVCRQMNVKKIRVDSPRAVGHGLLTTICMVELNNLVLSLDNTFAAISFSSNFMAVCLGVSIGMLTVRFIAGWLAKLMDTMFIPSKLPYVLVGSIAVQLIVDQFWHVSLSEVRKLEVIAIICIGGVVYDRVRFVNIMLSPLFSVIACALGAVGNCVDALFLWPFDAAKKASLKKKIC